MTAFIHEHRHVYRVEPICKALPIAPSAYYRQMARWSDPATAPSRVRRAERLCRDIRRVWDENCQVYGVRKVWRQLRRESVGVARYTVARLMGRLGLHGVVRGRGVRTTISDNAASCPLDKVNRQFRAERPNAL